MSEHDIIARFFDRPGDTASTTLGIGDDAALMTLPVDQTLAISVDTLVNGIHFFENTDPADIGYKAIAVSLSDMAAMAATPKTALLSLTLPTASPHWLQSFSDGLFELINEHNMQLIGGDITKGPLTITTVVNGWVPKGQAICRHGASVGDLIYVTGTLGDAGVALTNRHHSACLQRLNRPSPRIHVGIALRNLASAAIDISDGLASDLEKLCSASNVGAQVNVDDIPRNYAPIELALSAGDDFELCFTVPAGQQTALLALAMQFNCDIHCIGTITADQTVTFVQANDQTMTLKNKGYDHF